MQCLVSFYRFREREREREVVCGQVWWPFGALCFGALLKGLTSVVVLKVERVLPPTYNPWRTWDSNPRPSGYKSNSLSIRPRLPLKKIKKLRKLRKSNKKKKYYVKNTSGTKAIEKVGSTVALRAVWYDDIYISVSHKSEYTPHISAKMLV